jgi:hypothetical protein
VGSNLFQYTRWKWGKSHARKDFRHPILVQNDKKIKNNKGSQMGHTDKKILKKKDFNSHKKGIALVLNALLILHFKHHRIDMCYNTNSLRQEPYLGRFHQHIVPAFSPSILT